MAFQRAVQSVLGPPDSLVEVGARRQSRLLALALVSMLTVFPIVDVILWLTTPRYEPPWYGYVFLVATFALNRAGLYRAAATLVVVMVTTVVFAQLFVGTASPRMPLGFLVLGPMLATLLLSLPGVVVTSVVNVAALAALPYVAPKVAEATGGILAPLAANTLVGAIACLSIWQRDRAEAERRELGEELRQAQKMEALGRLAAGITHDFNNLLTVILGNVDLMQLQRPAKELDDIRDAVGSATELTRQLLAFSRKGPSAAAPGVVRIDDTLIGAAAMLQRLVGEEVKIQCDAPEDIWSVRVDPKQFEQAVVNLGTNARDAMPEGGRLTLRLSNVKIDSDNWLPLGRASGEFVKLSAIDTGVGMDPDTQRRAAEPFFTTKPPGKGTGLGLSMVFGFAQQAGGLLRIDSELGHGTTVNVLLPRALS